MGLWIKNADGTIEKAAGGGGGGGGPHNHAEYALVEHDHDEFTHDHDYLPLAGGTLTGDLTVDGNAPLKLSSATAADRQYSRIQTGTGGSIVLYSPYDSVNPGDALVECATLKVAADLQVGGTITAAKAGNQAVVQSDYFRAWAGSFGTPAFSFYGYPHLGIYLADGAGAGMLGVAGSLYVSGTIHGTLAFNVADGIDTADVLDRAETAAMPVDDEGVATTDAESITVNEVVTALLAKVKQLSAEIEELKKGA